MKRHFKRRATRPGDESGTGFAGNVESLESRQLLSTSPLTAHSNLTLSPAAAGSGIDGYSPSQIRHAYGLDRAGGDGTGQTIAIVDAFHDPSIFADLHTFDQTFGLADPPSFKAVNQTGGSTSSVKKDSGWASEIALDVEWAHAIAPKANILLVEASSDTLGDLLAAVDYARHASGVSVVSMSWGADEFQGQTQYDNVFTTPSGHSGVTFVAASGDFGSWYGPEWPSSSPNVVAVGGTSLLTSSASGAYAAEYGWRDSGGGISRFEAEPSYQSAAQHTGGRTTPDVSFNADPRTGFAVYSSISDAGMMGWSVVGGTSAAAPGWAGIIALADQARATAGKGSLDSAGTLSTLYGLGNAGAATYTASFHDVTVGRSSYFLGAHTGYDGVTGLGSPEANEVIGALGGTTATGATRKASSGAKLPSRLAKPALVAQTSAALPTPSAAINHTATNAQQTTISTTSELLAAIRTAPPSGRSFSVAATIAQGGARIAGAASFWQAEPEAQAAVAPVAQPGAPAVSAAGHMDLDQGMPADAALIPSLPNLAQLGGVNAFADAVASFAHESALLGSALVTDQSHARAWGVTIAVVAVDAILIGHWRMSRRQEQQARELETVRAHFSLEQIED